MTAKTTAKREVFYGFDSNRLEWFPLARAERADVLDGYDFAVHRFARDDDSLGDWMVTELTSGGVVTAGHKTRREASDYARKAIDGNEDRLREEIARIKTMPGWYARREG